MYISIFITETLHWSLGGLGSKGTADNNYNDEDVDKDDDNGHDDDDMKNIAMMMMMVEAHLGLLQVAEQ